MRIATFTLIALGMFGVASHGLADDQNIPLTDLPKAVLDAVKTQYPAAELKEAEKDVDNGVLTYEATLLNKGKSVEVTLTPEGKITRIVTVVDAKDLPSAVASTVAAGYPASKIKKAEEIVAFKKGEETKCYEVHVTTQANETVEVKLSADGKILKTGDLEDDDKA